MSCPRERDLALYVEDDLRVSEVAALQAHVLDCGTCRSFLLSLEASQQALKELAAEPITDEALATLRSRVTRLPMVRGRHVGLRWAFALVVAAALLPGVFLAITRMRGAAPAAPFEVVAVAPETQPSLPEAQLSPASPAPAPLKSESPGTVVPRKAVVRQPELSPEEVVALANAVVAVARIESVEDLRPREEASSEMGVDNTPLVRMATDDPNVVIYWRMESSGGK